MTDDAAEAGVTAAPPAAESGVEAAARQHGTTPAEAPAAGGGRTARQPASTLLSPSGTETLATTGKGMRTALDRQQYLIS